MHAEIVSIGTEILMGEIVDTNSGYLAAELAKIGVEVRWVSKVGDDPDRLAQVLAQAWERSDVTLTSGGLGPTSDDLTRESIARVMGEEMSVQDDLLAHLKAQFEGRGVPMPSTNVKQATLIESAETIPNPLGTAPGWWVHRDGRVIAAMPGPPRELDRMWADEVAPRLRELNPDIVIVTRTLKTFGISEGGLDEMLSPLFKSANPTLGIYSKEDGIHLRAIATAGSEDQARLLIEPMEREIRRVVGHAIWGLDGETAVTRAVAALRRAGSTLGVFEGFTGGLLASQLTEAPGSDDVLKGSLVATDGDLLRGLGASFQDAQEAASPDVARAMAEAARKLFGTDIGIGITGLVSRPTADGGPVGTGHMAFDVGGVVTTTSGSYPTQRLRTRSRAVTQALLELIRAMERN